MNRIEMLDLIAYATSEYPRLLRFAMDFVFDYEKHCCALLQKIINENPSIHVILEKGTENSARPKVYGVFTYEPKGRQVFSCLPIQNDAVKAALSLFFSNKSVFCISGYEPYTVFLESVVKQFVPFRETEIHNYYFMHFNPIMSYLENWYKGDASIVKTSRFNEIPESSKNAAIDWLCNNNAKIVKDLGIRQCNMFDAEGLFPLQLNYTVEEVLPKWRCPVPSAERLAIEDTLTHQFVYGIPYGKNFIAKANSNAVTPNYLQVGGVYTTKDNRGKGYASALVHNLAVVALKQNKQAVLFVRDKNIPAIKAYLNAGFETIGKYKIVYYMEESK